ncbi:hypothetical protein [Aureibacillus halotolerans]|uniref:Uncharacterized protein n=1 Tax=Aureibacillus halotolerans TaxID=1508390 RepID=A0A4R6U0D9_9BACI|nr:hypothetical protein [Aureibacillus halotolerans]TDQ38662.1 hypothetical protein EV213_10930 [Aureibacillus halotolerans]
MSNPQPTTNETKFRDKPITRYVVFALLFLVLQIVFGVLYLLQLLPEILAVYPNSFFLNVALSVCAVCPSALTKHQKTMFSLVGCQLAVFCVLHFIIVTGG